MLGKPVDCLALVAAEADFWNPEEEPSNYLEELDSFWGHPRLRLLLESLEVLATVQASLDPLPFVESELRLDQRVLAAEQTVFGHLEEIPSGYPEQVDSS